MGRVRSLLWVGRTDEFGCGVLAEDPSLDIAWVRDVDDALALPLAGFDALVLDAGDAGRGLAALRRLRRPRGAPPVLVRIHSHEAAHMPDLLAAGARDVVLRAESEEADDELTRRIDRLAAAPAPDPRDAVSPLAEIIGESAAMADVFTLVRRAARSHATVLVAGETGTGKELLARAVHLGGPRRDRPFLAVNCAAFPDTLLESELFGHRRGAFTGADREKKGLFEVADGGSLFLDEIGETSGLLQAKLLRVLQEREVRPVGGTQARSVDVRVIAATNRHLDAEVRGGRFREDLYYRLAVFPIDVPPLRARPDDVLPLARHFLDVHGRRDGKPGCRLSRDSAHLLQAYTWPGNVRELENEIQRAVALAEPGEPITPALLSERLLGIVRPVDATERDGETLAESLARVEAWLIRRALDAHGGRRALTARRLGLTREGLYKKMKRLGIE